MKITIRPITPDEIKDKAFANSEVGKNISLKKMPMSVLGPAEHIYVSHQVLTMPKHWDYDIQMWEWDPQPIAPNKRSMSIDLDIGTVCTYISDASEKIGFEYFWNSGLVYFDSRYEEKSIEAIRYVDKIYSELYKKTNVISKFFGWSAPSWHYETSIAIQREVIKIFRKSF